MSVRQLLSFFSLVCLLEKLYAQNNSIRIGDHRCLYPYQWLTKSVNNDTLWHGSPAALFKGIQHIIPAIEMLRLFNLNKSFDGLLDIKEGSHRAVLIWNGWVDHHNYFRISGLIDITPHLYGVTWERYQIVDFTTPISFVEMKIIFSNVKIFDESALLKIFDSPSHILILVSLILFTVAQTVTNWWAYLNVYSKYCIPYV